MFDHLYKKFHQYNQGKFYFTAHSHHFWPDITQEAQNQYWLDSAKMVDDKWDYIFSKVLPKTQSHISRILNFSRPQDIAIASNTHELGFRLLSTLDLRKKTKILTTNNEFHSFSRQVKRLSEWDNIEVVYKPINEFKDVLHQEEFDLVFFSQVFFDSGDVLEMSQIEKIVALSKNAIICIDGYHGFGAIPTDMSSIEDRVFYLGGSYKYAQGGEGACFLTLPKDCQLRPLYTGWFADFSNLENKTDSINYSDDGFRFFGSTMDMTALYRFNATWDLFNEENLSTAKINQHVRTLQKHWCDRFDSIIPAKLINQDIEKTGHFLSYEFDSENTLKAFYQDWKSKGIITDYRQNFLRVGFGLAQTTKYIDDAFDHLSH